MHKKRFLVFLLASTLVFSSIPFAYADEGSSEVLPPDMQALGPDEEALGTSPQTNNDTTIIEEGIEQDASLQTMETKDPADTVIPEVASERVGEEGSYIPGEIIVSFSDGNDIDGKIEALKKELCSYAEVALEQEAVDAYGAIMPLAEEATTTEDLDEEVIDTEIFSNPIASITIPDELSIEQAIAIAEATPGVIAVQANYVFEMESDEVEAEASWVPNDPFVGTGVVTTPTQDQWWLYRTKTIEAWNNSRFPAKPNMNSSSTVTVAVIDTGTNLNDPDLKANLDLQNAWDAVNDCKLADSPLFAGTDYYDMQKTGHGTDVSTTIAAVADNGIGNAGLTNNRVKVLPINVFYSTSISGRANAKTDDVIKGIKKAIEYKKQGVNIRVMNMSLGGYIGGTHAGAVQAQPVTYSMFNDARSMGILPVASGGNDSSQTSFHWPSDYDNVVAVTGLKNSDESFGDHNQYKNICAPYEIIKASSTNDNRKSGFGTSFSSPMVSAAAALLFVADPSLTPERVEKVLYDTADDLGPVGHDYYYGNGVLDVEEALDVVLGTQNKINISNASVSSISVQTYTGRAITPEPVVTYAGKTLVKGSDYTLSYTNNIELGNVARVKITGIGNYAGSTSVAFSIEETSKINISKAKIENVDDVEYTGAPFTPDPQVSYEGRKLVKGTDYTVSYSSNVNYGVATITFTGIGAFTGTAKVAFLIYPNTIAAATISTIPDQSYTGGALTPEPVLTFNGKTLVKGVDYVLEYSNNINVGTGKITLYGRGNFASVAWTTFSIVQSSKTSISGATVANISAQTYTGSAITPNPLISYGGKALVRGTDYTLAYSNNVNAGTATITITGIGGYSGSLGKNFTINKASLSSASRGPVTVPTYTGSALTPEIPLSYLGKTLKQGTDYTISYRNNINAGVGSATMVGMGNFTGTYNTSFSINKAAISLAAVASISDQGHTGKAITPEPRITFGGKTLVKGSDYTLSYRNNISAGTATITIYGTGNFNGSTTTTFKIVQGTKTSIASVSVADIPNQIYSGSALMPNPVVTYGGKALVKGSDYTLTYRNNTNAGFATVTITGIGSYEGSRSEYFWINPVAIFNASINSIPTQSYTGSAVTPEPILSYKGKTLVKNVDYVLSYSNNVNVGIAKITIAGRGNFAGLFNKSFTIAQAPSSKVPISAAYVSSVSSQTYTGNAFTPTPLITYGGRALMQGADFTLTYRNNTNAGTATIIITGIGNYTGSRSITFTISKADIQGIRVETHTERYTGYALTPDLPISYKGMPLKLGTDYTLSYSNNTKVGMARVTVTGMGNFTGTRSTIFYISR